MMQEIYATCKHPTPTITKGQDYLILSENDNKISIINDQGIKIELLKKRFSEIFIIEKKMENKKQIICVNSGKFKNISKDDVFVVEKETKDFYYILSKKNQNLTRYHKKYFNEIINIEEEKVETPKVICIFPVAGELSFKKEYEFKVHEDKSRITILSNNKKEQKTYLIKRFKV